MSTPEGLVVTAIMEFLGLQGIYAWRSNSGALHGGGRLVRYGKPGAADIIGILPGGRFLAIECKAKGEKPTDLQREFIAAIQAHGGLAIVARSVFDVATALPGGG